VPALPAAARLLPLHEACLELFAKHEGNDPTDQQQGSLREIHASPPVRPMTTLAGL
jgi:hypothetical protein